jgi:DNA transformation protein
MLGSSSTYFPFDMGFTPEYRAEIEKKLAKVLPVQTKAMFGGVGIYAEGLFFALIAEDRFYLKVDDTNRPDFEKAGMAPFHPDGLPKPMHYWELPPGVIDRPKDLKKWIDKALLVAKSAARQKHQPARRPRSK